MDDCEFEIVDESPPTGFRLRQYQQEWKDNIRESRARGFSRLLLDAVGGSGKTSLAASVARDEWDQHQGRVLIIENRQQLVMQTAQRLRDESGLEVDIEMAEHRASPYAQVVVSCAPSISRHNRLTGFKPDHFRIVFHDEAHNLSPSALRIMHYFHYGAESLAEGWTAPKDGEYRPLCTIIGITATPDTHGNRNLGNLYQKFVARYSYLQAIEDGWLVGIREINIPVKIDTRKFRKKTTGHGVDFSPEDESNAIIPIIEELAGQIVTLASNRKTMCFLPSKECATLMSEALNRRGLRSLYVLGECLDRDEKTDQFKAAGPGICLCLCAMYVEGTDFPDVDTVAWMRATLSPSFYKQGIYRCSRALSGLLSDEMGAEARRAAIAASRKPWSMVISPFFISDRINIMEVSDLFVDQGLKGEKKGPSEFTDAAKIRDYIEALHRAAEKNQNKKARAIDPIRFAVSVGIDPDYIPASPEEAVPPSQQERDTLVTFGLNSTLVKTSGQAQMLIQNCITRDKNGLASPKVLQQLTLRLGWPPDLAEKINAKQGGMMVAKGVRYRRPAKQEEIERDLGW